MNVRKLPVPKKWLVTCPECAREQTFIAFCRTSVRTFAAIAGWEHIDDELICPSCREYFRSCGKKKEIFEVQE